MMKVYLTSTLIGLTLFLQGCDNSEAHTTNTISAAEYKGSGSVTFGIAETTTPNLFPKGGRVAEIGTIKSINDNTTWTVPAAVNFTNDKIPFAPDLYNDYGQRYNDAKAALAALDTKDIIEIDADGEIVTVYIFADNYFEMYINGVAVGKDPVPFTQFNANIIQFKVKKPFDVAVLAVDWEENLGTGTESNRGVSAHPGDGGFVAVFKNADDQTIAITDSTWKAQNYYTSPITDLSCLTESGTSRLSTQCTIEGTNDASVLYGVHWAIPKGWEKQGYDDSQWPAATTFSNDTVGVDNKKSYTNFTDIFDNTEQDAQFIWSTNLNLDNKILLRKTVAK
ncbi:hypothetical protein OW492_16860 [Psychromonas sp. 14N.309.X.WAT.B.A12]|uniref:hypothetical protein n=1 Tax=Psychromonas sp. 14N.309.X.WAT.B.A12 TaxID=2998322 RepID=UPI0025B05AFF|nr:hypothetical protein [Psychromonas sp. 14N.309.X.WAT.B.A12]MDN2665041.1 hypothetical protein [Psychromonas sp. 14N.309.X.WAT.B.A12]